MRIMFYCTESRDVEYIDEAGVSQLGELSIDIGSQSQVNLRFRARSKKLWKLLWNLEALKFMRRLWIVMEVWFSTANSILTAIDVLFTFLYLLNKISELLIKFIFALINLN